MLDDKPLIELNFPAGKNNVSRETDVPDGAVRELLNADVYDSGEISRRKGYSQIYDGGGDTIHSLYSGKLHTVFARGTTLRTLDQAYATTTLRSDLHPNYLSYAEINDWIYYCNGHQSGIVLDDGTHAEWGVPTPGQPTLGVTTGGLDAGTYQVAITYVSSIGEESGAKRAATVQVPASGGITLVSIPQGDAAFVNIYVSPPNGDVLYKHVQLPMGVTSGTILNSVDYGRTLETQFMERMPAGSIARYYRGHMWVAVGSTLLFSPSMRYGLYDPRHTYIMFPEAISMIQPVLDGLYVSSDKTYFLSGADPMNMTQSFVSADKAVQNTGMSVPPDIFERDLIGDVQDDVAFWFSSQGAMLGLPGGRVIEATSDRLSIPEYGRGASLLREEDGIRQLVTSLTNKGPGSGFVATDVATAEIRRNGVILT